MKNQIPQDNPGQNRREQTTMGKCFIKQIRLEVLASDVSGGCPAAKMEAIVCHHLQSFYLIQCEHGKQRGPKQYSNPGACDGQM